MAQPVEYITFLSGRVECFCLLYRKSDPFK